MRIGHTVDVKGETAIKQETTSQIWSAYGEKPRWASQSVS